MRLREFLALALLGVAAVAQADPSDYGKVETFQPGKKYNCVPTADRKGWDCKVTGAAEIPSQPEAASRPQPAEPAAPPPAATPPPQSAPTPQASALPGYLAAPNPDNAMQPMPAAPAPKPAPKPRVKGPMVPARIPAPAPAATSAPIAESAPAITAPNVAAPAAPRAPAATIPAGDFLALPADAYVVELAHAAVEADLAAPNPVHEKVYKLHLHQNGADVWLLVCGPYDSLQAARAARDELAMRGATPGWPRRIGPLQTELGRAQH